jgi:hypothetical protein
MSGAPVGVRVLELGVQIADGELRSPAEEGVI